jgi:hypothetical protein
MAIPCIFIKNTPTKMDYFPLAIKVGFDKANIYAIDIQEITAKRKKFDAKGGELKWGRME